MSEASSTSWLPAKFNESEYANIDALEVAAYVLFQRDWAISFAFRGNEVRVHRQPHKAREDRWHTYWHMVTEGSPEEERDTPLLDRLERVPWCRPVIENESQPEIKVWENTRGRDKHICIWFDRVNYIAILKQCRDHVLLKTTYCPERRRKQQLHKEYARYQKTGCAQ